jgi:hypothetical protein
LTQFGTLAAIDPFLKTPYTMNFSLGVQRELPWGLFGEVNFVGNLGRNLTRNPDINQIPFGAGSDNSQRPFKGYSAIMQRKSDSNSYYYAGQFYVAKRKGDFLATGSYTWSKVLTDASNFNDNPKTMQTGNTTMVRLPSTAGTYSSLHTRMLRAGSGKHPAS